MSLANGLQLFDEQAARAATARRIHRSEHWLAATESDLRIEEHERGN
ncbi:hypothetical protein [Arthrobacter psychrolactophilus]